MAKTLSEELLALIADDPAATARVKAAIANNPALLARDMKSTEIYDIYSGFEPEPVAAPAVPSVVHTPTLPSSATTSAAATAPVTTSTNDGYAAILAKLSSLETGIDAKLDARLKNVVTTDKVPEFFNNAIAASIRGADQYARIREAHIREFPNDPLDTEAYEKFVTDAQAAGRPYPSFKAAHDVFVADKRKTAGEAAKKAEIDAAVAEALKQVWSSSTVPGQTVTAGMSPAAAVLAKARANKTANGESNAMIAARKLEAQERAAQDTIQ